MAVKWRNWKTHFYRQESMVDPSVKNPVPVLYNLFTDPREEKPTVDTWVIYPMLKIVGAFEGSVKRYPPIPMGTPDPYEPPGGNELEVLKQGEEAACGGADGREGAE